MTPLTKPRFKLDSVTDFVRLCNASNVPATFNVDIDRKGMFNPESLALLREAKDRLQP